MRNPWLNAQIGLQLKALDHLEAESTQAGSTNRHTRRSIMAGAIGGTMLTPVAAFAADPGASADKAAACSSVGGTSGLTKIIQDAASFLMVIGGVLFILMVVIGGFLIMGGAANKKYVDRGMTIAKNALIGLVILVGAWFVRDVVLQFVSGATNSGGTTSCAGGGTNPNDSGGKR